MRSPQNYEEYERRFAANQEIGGSFLNTYMSMPCPFCAAPGFMTLRLFQGIAPGDDSPDIDTQMSQEKTCSECGRSAKALINRDSGSVEFEFVQTGGADQPDWLPKMRRIEEIKE